MAEVGGIWCRNRSQGVRGLMCKKEDTKCTYMSSFSLQGRAGGVYLKMAGVRGVRGVGGNRKGYEVSLLSVI